MATTEERLAALESRNRDLSAEVDRLRPKPPPPPRPARPQDYGQGNRSAEDLALGTTGAHYTGPPSGSGGPGGSIWRFDAYRMIGGQRTYAPDGVARDPATGEAITAMRRPGPHEGPKRTSQHELAVRIIDSAMPIVRPVFDE